MANGCGGCGKPRPGPHGSQKPVTPNTSSTDKPSTSLTSQTQSFKLNLAGGEKVHVTGSLLEAQATLMRLGGRGTIDC